MFNILLIFLCVQIKLFYCHCHCHCHCHSFTGIDASKSLNSDDSTSKFGLFHLSHDDRILKSTQSLLRFIKDGVKFII